MDNTPSPITGVSDTARWVAYFRARETERPDALFRDPFAANLAGDLGFEIAHTLPEGTKHEWAWVARTYLFDRFLSREIDDGAEVVVNLAAGLDARPYRMQLPATLHWIEVDFPDIVSYKEQRLAAETPGCKLERVGLDLSDLAARRKFLAGLQREGKRVVVASEGLLIYFTPEEVASLAADLFQGGSFVSWIIDLASPGQLKLMQRTTGKSLSEAGAPFQFGPAEGADFFLPYGWKPADVQGLLKTAAQLKRAPAELLSLLPEPKLMGAHYPWTGVCRLRRS